MSIDNDQAFARRMLEARESGYTFGLFYRRSARSYLLLVAGFAAALWILAVADLWTLVWCMVGMFVGCVMRDVGWVRAMRRAWPFSERVTNWDQVQKLADDSPPT